MILYKQPTFIGACLYVLLTNAASFVAAKASTYKNVCTNIYIEYLIYFRLVSTGNKTGECCPERYSDPRHEE